MIEQPTAISKALGARAETTMSPRIVPGTLPATIQPIPERSIACLSRIEIVSERGIPMSRNDAGTASGLIIAIIGTPMRLSPSPTTPCVVAPKVTTAKQSPHCSRVRCGNGFSVG
ncbi:unannotated protein [freshwater metagenome]|uniref:Unannotated protein n=1 Tax=freshwater metagenome TaxID=449393 RepID=A0A6J7DZW2_9ZZZZ